MILYAAPPELKINGLTYFYKHAVPPELKDRSE